MKKRFIDMTDKELASSAVDRLEEGWLTYGETLYSAEQYENTLEIIAETKYHKEGIDELIKKEILNRKAIIDIARLV